VGPQFFIISFLSILIYLKKHGGDIPAPHPVYQHPWVPLLGKSIVILLVLEAVKHRNHTSK
jgi:hypothetical protein